MDCFELKIINRTYMNLVDLNKKSYRPYKSTRVHEFCVLNYIVDEEEYCVISDTNGNMGIIRLIREEHYNDSMRALINGDCSVLEQHELPWKEVK